MDRRENNGKICSRVEREYTVTQSFRLLADSRCLRNCAGKKFDRIVKRGVPDPRVPCSACIYIPAFKRHTGLRRTHTGGGARARAYVQSRTVYIDLYAAWDMPGYVFYCFRRERVSGSYARSDRSSGGIGRWLRQRPYPMPILLHGLHWVRIDRKFESAMLRRGIGGGTQQQSQHLKVPAKTIPPGIGTRTRS